MWVRVYSVLGALICLGFVMAHTMGWHGFNWIMPRPGSSGPTGGGYRAYHK